MKVQRPSPHQRKVTEVPGKSGIWVAKNELPKFWLEKFEDRKLTREETEAESRQETWQSQRRGAG